MKANDIHYTGVHPDCPFTKEEIDNLRAMLYGVASANNIVAYPSWYVGYNNHQIRMAGRRHRVGLGANSNLTIRERKVKAI